MHYWVDLHGFRYHCYDNIVRTRNISECMLVLAVCLVTVLEFFRVDVGDAKGERSPCHPERAAEKSLYIMLSESRRTFVCGRAGTTYVRSSRRPADTTLSCSRLTVRRSATSAANCSGILPTLRRIYDRLRFNRYCQPIRQCRVEMSPPREYVAEEEFIMPQQLAPSRKIYPTPLNFA